MSASVITRNQQDANVGNPGDIIKHAALLQLIKFFNALAGHKVYLDTHCYLPRAQLSNQDWSDDVTRLLQAYPLYRDYAALQRPYIEQGEYLCSSGIVLERSGEIELLLSESNPHTRTMLQQQLRGYDAKTTVKDNMALWYKYMTIKKNENIFILLDPFNLTKEVWQTICLMLEKDISATSRGLLLVFDYDKSDEHLAWPKAAAGWAGPAARLSHTPYHLAVYSTPSIRQAVASLLAPLGWRV